MNEQQKKDYLALQEQVLRKKHQLQPIPEAILARQLASLKSGIRDQKIQPPFDARYHIPYHELAIDAVLPAGKFGKVYQGRWGEQKVAIRWLPGRLSVQDEKLFIASVDLMIRLNHPCLVKFYGACLENHQACVITEYFPEGHLLHFINKRTLNAVERHELLLSLLSGLAYLHSQEVVHGNLKPSNIFVVFQEGRWQVRISNYFHRGLSFEQSVWFPPENRWGDTPIPASDVYQFGLLLWMLCTEREPGKNWKPVGVTDLFYSMWIDWCCDPNSLQRLALNEIVEAFEAHRPFSRPARVPASSKDSHVQQGVFKPSPRLDEPPASSSNQNKI